MQTERLNNNTTMRVGVIFMVISIITLIAVVMTFAKYASQGTGEDRTRIAKWGLNVNENLDLKLFSSSYKDPLDKSITVDASDDASVIAPGTTQEATVQLASYTGQPPEVMYHFEPSLTITNLGDTGQNLIAKLNQNNGFKWTLKVNDGATTTYNTTNALCSVVSALGQKDIPPNTYPSNFGTTTSPKITIGWIWDFNNGGDQSDTELGNLIADNDLKEIKVELGIKAYQCQGCNAAKSLLCTYNGTTTYFVPAFNNKSELNEVVFYNSAEEKIDEISNGNCEDMKTMAEYYNLPDGNVNKPVKAFAPEGTKFYTLVNASYDTAFDTTTNPASAFNSDFVNSITINEGQHPGVYDGPYFEYDGEGKVKGNWDKTTTRCPKLNGVNYGVTIQATGEFYGAYKDVLIRNAIYPWGSRALESDIAQGWSVYAGLWGYTSRSYLTGVVISLTF